MVKTHSKTQGILSLVTLPKMDELYAILKCSTVYLSLGCTSGYHHIALSSKAQEKPAFITPIGKFKFKKVTFCLSRALAHLQ